MWGLIATAVGGIAVILAVRVLERRLGRPVAPVSSISGRQRWKDAEDEAEAGTSLASGPSTAKGDVKR